MTKFSIQPPTSLSLDVDRDGDLDTVRQGTFNVTEATAYYEAEDGKSITSEAIIDSIVPTVSISSTIGGLNPITLFEYPEETEVLRVVGFFDPITVDGRTGNGGTEDIARFDILVGEYSQGIDESTIYLPKSDEFAGYQITDLGVSKAIFDNNNFFGNSRPILAMSPNAPELDGLNVVELNNGIDQWYVGYQKAVPSGFFAVHGTTRGLGGGSFRDPHLYTLDGLDYYFHAAGEFTLVESTEDNFQVQVRAEHLSSGATFNTAAATEIDGTRVAFYANEQDFLLIDGKATELASGESISLGDGLISRDDDTYTVTYDNSDASHDPDQLVVTLKERSNFGDFFLNVETLVADSRQGSVAGLLGNNNGIKGDDLALPDGTVLSTPVNFDQFYTDFANGWRIEQNESLFDYAQGENTSTYTETNFFDNDNVIVGLDVTEYIYAGAGNDIVIGSDNADILDGEEGRDTLDYGLGEVGVTIDLGTNSAAGGQAEGDLIANFENIYGSQGDDYLTGDAGNNTFKGREGKDILTGGEGKDNFNFKNLSDSLLSDFDVITDLAIGTDKIIGAKPVDAGKVMELGSVAALDETSIQAVLSESEFMSYGAATFSYDSQTFIALNDNAAGYSADNDAVIEITGMSGYVADLAIL